MELSYEQSVKELEELLSKIDDPQKGLSDIAADVKRAKELISYCKSAIKTTEQELEQILNEDEQK